jgi:predicted Zn finger-like uncharacterized protein
MYSQCPDCQTRFRVTADELRAARGTVRCGRCGSAFDALARLSDTVPPAAQEQPPVALEVTRDVIAGSEPQVHTEYHFTAEDLERVFVEEGKWNEPLLALPRVTELATENAPAGTEPSAVVVDEQPGGEDITLEGERVSIEAPAQAPREQVDLDSTDELEILRYVPDSAYPEEEDEDAERMIEPVTPRWQAQPEPVVAAPAATVTAAREPVATAEPTTPGPPAWESIPLSAQRWRRPVDDSEPEAAPRASPWGTLAWTLASLALALVLAGQLIHYFRQDLARHPQIGPPLRVAYERLGLELQPNWDLAAIELRQWGNDADAAARGRMVVRASLTNRAAFAQPHPILRLELEDRFGATVATRDFEPADYLKNPSQATRLMTPGASSEAELLLADPGKDAVGYRLDVCLRESPALLRCASGPG